MTRERLNELKVVEGQIEELKTEKESMRKLLDKKGGEMNDLQRQLEEVRSTAANDQVELGRLKHLVFTMQFKYEAMEEKELLRPTSKSNGMLEKFKIRCVREFSKIHIFAKAIS